MSSFVCVEITIQLVPELIICLYKPGCVFTMSGCALLFSYQGSALSITQEDKNKHSARWIDVGGFKFYLIEIASLLEYQIPTS